MDGAERVRTGRWVVLDAETPAGEAYYDPQRFRSEEVKARIRAALAKG